MSFTNKLKDGRDQFGNLAANGFNAIKQRYLTSSGWNARHETYEQFGSSSGFVDPLFLAKAAFELAVTSHYASNTDTLLTESVGHAHHAINTSGLSPYRSVLSHMFFINLPLLSAVHLDKSHPSPELIQKARDEGMKTLVMTRPKDVTNIPDAIQYSGAVSEFSALVLKQTFALEELGGEDWTAVPALLSQDYGSKKGSSQNMNWDISVFAGDDEKETYKTQVKYGRLVRNRMYHDDISVVNMKYDIVIGKEQEVSFNRLIDEFKYGFVNDNSTQHKKRLFKRAQQLVDFIDPPDMSIVDTEN